MTKTMQLTEGMSVVTSQGEDVGEIERLVVDPHARQVSHVVVSKGVILTEERVVPVDRLLDGTDDEVVLSGDVVPDDLPPFEEAHYLPLDEAGDREYLPAAARTPLIWSYPAYGWAAPAHSDLMASRYPLLGPVEKEVHRNVPDGMVTVETGAAVVTSDDEEIGTVAGVEIDADDALVSLTVDPGWLKERRAIPAHFVDRVEDGGAIRLAVGSSTLDAWRAR